MSVVLTASHDACQPVSSRDKNEPIHWLSPRAPQQRRLASSARHSLLRLTTSLGIGACLTMASASSALAPAVAADTTPLTSADLRIAIPAPAPVDLAGLGVVRVALAKPAPVNLSRGFDPLTTIVPVAAADSHNLRAEIITGIPLMEAPEEPAVPPSERLPCQMEEHVSFDTMRVPRWIVDTILRASDETGVDPVYMMALADKESSFIPANKASTSSAEGLFQFVTSTWLEVMHTFGAKHGFNAEADAIKVVNGELTLPEGTMRDHILRLRRSPYVSAIMAAEMMKRDREKIESKLGRKITRSEFYLSHFFGVNSASKFISLVDDKPKQNARRIFPAAAKANRSLFYDKKGRKTRQLSVAEVYGKIDEMIDKRLDRYEDVSTIAVASEADL